MTVPDLDPRHPANIADPFPLFHYLREQDPVHWSESLQGWIISRYADARAAFNDPKRFASDRMGRVKDRKFSSRPSAGDVWDIMGTWLAFRDPPDHTRIRRLLNMSFTPRHLESMRPRIQGLVDSLLDAVGGQGEMEFIRDFAFPLPANVIALMLGAPPKDLDRIKEWSDGIAKYIGGAQKQGDNMDSAKQGLFEMYDYFDVLARERRNSPKDDLLSLMLAARDEGGVLSDHEVVSSCILLLFGGHETTASLLSTGLYHLLRHPEQLRLMREHPELIPGAVEELLRYDGPIPMFVKIIAEDLEFQGKPLKAGQIAYLGILSANRDPREFPDPDTLDVTRRKNRHLAFGQGIHFCLGAPLSRLEADIAFTTLLRRMGPMTLLRDDLEWRPQLFLRGLKSLPVGFEAAAASA